MLIGIWNMEWASPGTAESGAAQSQVEGLGFDVFVGNEVTLGALLRGSHMVDGGLARGYEVPPHPRRRLQISGYRRPGSYTA